MILFPELYRSWLRLDRMYSNLAQTNGYGHHPQQQQQQQPYHHHQRTSSVSHSSNGVAPASIAAASSSNGRNGNSAAMAAAVDDDDDEFDRGHWGSKAEFILSCIGFSVRVDCKRVPANIFRNRGNLQMLVVT